MNHERAFARTARAHLRLVTRSVEQAVSPSSRPQSILELASVAAAGTNVLSPQVIAHMLQVLEAGDWVEFRHDVASKMGRPTRYRLSVLTNATGQAAASCAAAIRIASPLLGWGIPLNDLELDNDGLDFRASFVPAASRVFTGLKHDATPVLLPAPCSLPDWRLTAVLSGAMSLPDRLRLRIRLQPYRLDESGCETIWRALQQLRANACRVYHPNVKPGPYTASESLRNDLMVLLQAWLAQPCGYLFTLKIAASDALDPMTTAHIARDVFGTAPFEISHNSQPGTYGWTLHRALRFEQGLPALLPQEQLAASLGIRRHYPSPQARATPDGCLIGHVADKHGDCVVGLPESLRSRHVAVIGSSGTGKSSLMLNMIEHDMVDPARPGVVLIDPHGDLYQSVLCRIPSNRRADVVLVDVTDTHYTACINPLATGHMNPTRRAYVINGLLELIDLLFESDHTRGPMLSQNLQALLDLASGYPGRPGTFLDVMRALREPDFIEWLISKLAASHPESVAHWKKFQRTTGDHGFANWVPFLSARFGPFTSSPAIKRLLCRPEPTVDFDAIFRERKIVLFNFSKSVMQDVEARVASSVALMQLFSAAMARVRRPEAERFPVHLYVDEFQSIATASTGQMLAEARKLNLCLTVAFQNLGQLKTKFAGGLMSTLLANTATRLLFRLNPGDALILEQYYMPALNMSHMTTMADFHAACVLPGQSGSGAVVVRCHKPVETSDLQEVFEWPAEARGGAVSAANQELLKLYEVPLSSLGHEW